MSVRSRTVDAVFSMLEGIASLYDFVSRLRRPRKPKPKK